MRTAPATLTHHSSLFLTAAALVVLLALPSAALAGTDGPRVYGISYLDGSRTMISFVIGVDVSGTEYRAVAGVYQEYSFECFSVEGYPQRVYCVGPKLPEGMLAHIALFHSGSSEPVLDTIHSTPTIPTPTPEPKAGPTPIDPP